MSYGHCDTQDDPFSQQKQAERALHRRVDASSFRCSNSRSIRSLKGKESAVEGSAMGARKA